MAAISVAATDLLTRRAPIRGLGAVGEQEQREHDEELRSPRFSEWMRHNPPRMTELLPHFLEHVRARVAAGGGRAAVPADLAAFAREQPREALAMIVAALAVLETPEEVRVAGDGLLEDLLNESSDAVAADVLDELRRSKRFRQAFAFGEHASVDPALVNEWSDALTSLGTSKKALRRALWSKKK